MVATLVTPTLEEFKLLTLDFATDCEHCDETKKCTKCIFASLLYNDETMRQVSLLMLIGPPDAPFQLMASMFILGQMFERRQIALRELEKLNSA